MTELTEINSEKLIKTINNDQTSIKQNNIVKKPIERKRSFIKTPSFSEYLEHFQNGEFDASQKPEIIFCGQQTFSRQVLIIALLSAFFLISAIGVYFLWYTDRFEAAILKGLVLANNTHAFFMWKNPTVKTLLKVRVFNYTNVDDFMAGNADKLQINEVGPYVYEETMERVNIKFNGNSTVTYQEKRRYIFRPDLSHPARQSDKVTVPNIPLIGALGLARNSFYVVRWTLNRLINDLSATEFKTLPAHRFLWGYEDSLISLAKGILAWKGDFSLENFGLIALRNGTSRDRITIHTGEKELNKLGMIDQFNGESQTNFWSTEECNRVDGTDGAHFPLEAVHNLERIYVYNKEICRKLPLEYTESVLVQLDNATEMPALRYRFPKNVFSSPDITPENQCFCDLDSGVCPPSGIFNATRCLYNLPFYPSFPHFYMADEKLRNLFDGLHPDPDKHATFLDIHPNLAFPISGSSRMQVNIQVKKAPDVGSFAALNDSTILPIAWLEVSLAKLPQDVIDLLYHATFSAATTKTVLRFISLIVAGITLSLLLTWLYAHYTSKLYQQRLTKQFTNVNGNSNGSNSNSNGDMIVHQPIS